MSPSLLLMLALAAGPDSGSAQSPHVRDTSFVAPNGSPTLQQSVDVDAPASVLFNAYVTPKEFARWNAPFEVVDLRVGGTMETSYDKSAKVGDPNNIKHRIITYLPDRLLVFQNIQAPKNFPHPETFQRTVIVVSYEPLGPAKTRVTAAVTGWADGADDRKIYEVFRDDDAKLLEKLRDVYGEPSAVGEATPQPRK